MKLEIFNRHFDQIASGKKTFEEFIDSLKQTSAYELIQFYDVLQSTTTYASLKSKLPLTSEQYLYLFNAVETFEELAALNLNSNLLLDLTLQIQGGFNEIVDKYTSIQPKTAGSEKTSLFLLVRNETFFQNLMSSNKRLLDNEEINYFLSKFDTHYNLVRLFDQNRVLTRYCFENFVFDNAVRELFDEFVRNSRFCENCTDSEKDAIHFYTYAKLWYSNKIRKKEDVEISRCIDSYELLHTSQYSLNQRQHLSEIVNNSSVAREVLKQIVDNNLIDKYSFEQLLNLLTNHSSKRKSKLNC